MGKVSIGLLGWRFDEDDILDEDGEFLPLDEMPIDARDRLIRLDSIYNAPCHCCWLRHGDANLEACNTAQYVYGEPLAEVLLCTEHEPDFIYWFRKERGIEYRGTPQLQDAFHEWFLEGGRAPDGYEGMEYVETDPDELPKPPKPDSEEYGELMDDDPTDRLRVSDADIADSGVDFQTEYPRDDG